MIKLADRMADTVIDGRRPLTICSCLKITYGIAYWIVMTWLFFAAWYIVDPDFRFICAFTPSAFCEVLARGCDGVIASGYYYNDAGECVRDSTAH